MDNEKDFIELELYVLKPHFLHKDDKKWNVVEKLIAMRGYKIGDKYKILSTVDVNSKDVSELMAISKKLIV